MENLKKAIYLYLEKYPPSLELINILENAGDMYLIGGVLREFKDNGNIIELRDIDIIVDIKNDEYWRKIPVRFGERRNRFGGYKLLCSGLIVDIWSLKETWAYKNHIIKCDSNEYVQRLTDTVFLNVDSIVYDLKENKWYDKRYQEAMDSRILDIVLECNPEIPLNIIRAMILKKRYNMSYSEKLKNIIKHELISKENLIDILMDVQLTRYHKQILSRKSIERELTQI